MLPDRVSNPGPLTYESGVLPIALRGPALNWSETFKLLHIIVLLSAKFQLRWIKTVVGVIRKRTC